MGLFDKLFGSDPKKDLAKAEEWLAKNQPHRTLELTRKVLSNPGAVDPEKAKELMGRARAQLIDNALAMADEATESEFYQDAAEWVERALEQTVDAEQRSELEKRRLFLLEMAEKVDLEPEFPTTAESDDQGALGFTAKDHFEALVDMFDDTVAAGYLRQGETFRSAYLALHAGDPGEASAALETFDLLVKQAPEDPVRRFERGRARLFQNDAAGAREDFEVAWEAWGDIFLDRAASLTVPGLWAEALLELGEPAPLLERLESLAQPENGQPSLSLPYAQGLIMSGDLQAAEAFLRRATARFVESDFSLLLGQLMANTERREEAIAVMEAAVGPSCATGNCAKPPLHVPSTRLLVALFLAEGRLDRVEDLLAHIARRLGGQLGWEDHLLLAQLHRQKGDEEGALEAEADAEAIRQLMAEKPEVGELNTRPQGSQQRSVL